MNKYVIVFWAVSSVSEPRVCYHPVDSHQSPHYFAQDTIRSGFWITETTLIAPGSVIRIEVIEWNTKEL